MKKILIIIIFERAIKEVMIIIIFIIIWVGITKTTTTFPPIDVTVEGIITVFIDEGPTLIKNIVTPKTVRPFVKTISESELQLENDRDPKNNDNNDSKNKNNKDIVSENSCN